MTVRDYCYLLKSTAERTCAKLGMESLDRLYSVHVSDWYTATRIVKLAVSSQSEVCPVLHGILCCLFLYR